MLHAWFPGSRPNLVSMTWNGCWNWNLMRFGWVFRPTFTMWPRKRIPRGAFLDHVQISIGIVPSLKQSLLMYGSWIMDGHGSSHLGSNLTFQYVSIQLPQCKFSRARPLSKLAKQHHSDEDEPWSSGLKRSLSVQKNSEGNAVNQNVSKSLYYQSSSQYWPGATCCRPNGTSCLT